MDFKVCKNSEGYYLWNAEINAGLLCNGVVGFGLNKDLDYFDSEESANKELRSLQEYIDYVKQIANASKSKVHTHTDCRSDEGITVGLINSIMFISRVLAKKDLSLVNVKEALVDLYQDEDFQAILGEARKQNMERL